MSALIQQTPEWEEARNSKIGSSDAPVIMGVSPYKTPYQLWQEKLGFSKTFVNYAMKRGTAYEEKARQKFESMTGLLMFPCVIFHPEHEFMMASLDGMDLEGKYVLEIKCNGKEDHELAKQGVISDKYFPQMQHQLSCRAFELGFYFSYDLENDEGVIVDVKPDASYIKKMIYKEQDFYESLSTFEPPALTERDYQKRDDDIWNAAAQQYLQTRNALVKLEKQEKELKDALICMSGKSNMMGGGIKLSKVMRKGSVSYAEIPDLANLDLEKYRKSPVETWRITSY